MAPQYAAEALLRAEGFTDVRYVAAESTDALMARGEVDFSLNFAASLVMSMEAGEPVTVLAGVHPGCFELFGNEHIHGIADLRGKSVGVRALGSSAHVFLSVMAIYVGVDPAKDINWVASPSVRPIELFADGRIDAFLGFPPDPQEVRARNLGHVIVNSTLDHPWSQYFCCMLEGNRDFVDAHPIATKRVVRAILKATDLCVSAPKEVAQRMVDRGVAARYDYALQALSEVLYGTWREGDPEDTLRFYALRLHEAGMIRSDPRTIITKGTEWRFLNELRRELKG
jgi:NitT/TauT family transport system substrate-binding protein